LADMALLYFKMLPQICEVDNWLKFCTSVFLI
jgi:hypothetical protein